MLDVRGEACAGPGRERDLCICIMTPSGYRLIAISSIPASRCEDMQITGNQSIQRKCCRKQAVELRGWCCCIAGLAALASSLFAIELGR